MYLSLYCKGSKRVTQGFAVRGSWRLNKDCNLLTPLLWPSALCLSRSPDAQTEGRGPTLLAFSPASYHQLVWSPNSIRGPKSPFGLVWLSLPHLITASLVPNSSGAPRAPSAGLSLPHLISNFSGPQLTDFLSSQSYIIVHRPLNPWNGMFDRHQAEITVMQFTGHSLPVQQSMSVPWDFLSCPISSAKPAYVISSHNCHWNVSLPSSASPWNGIFARAEGQYTTQGNTNATSEQHIANLIAENFAWASFTKKLLKSIQHFQNKRRKEHKINLWQYWEL